MATFAEILVKLRKEKRLTQKSFAEAIGYSKDTIASWETGRRDPDLNALLELARFFDVNPSYLTGENISRIPGEASTEAYWDTSKLIEYICEDVQKLDLDDCFAVYECVQKLLRRHGNEERPQNAYKILPKSEE